MSKFSSTTLGEIIKLGKGKIQTGPFGSQLHASDYVDSGIPCVMPANMKDNQVDLSNIAYISEKDAQRLSQHITQTGDILYSRRGDVTQKAYIDKEQAGYFCGTGCLLVRSGTEIDSKFLLYHLSTPKNKDWIVSQAVGATMPNLNTKILSDVPLFLPEKSEQRKIATFLSSLDTKIDCNNRINAELEAMAKTLYDYWFVQFDFPNKDGKPYKSSGGAMQYNEELKRDIPEGWEVKKLGYIATQTRGVTYNKAVVSNCPKNDYLPILRANNLNNGRFNFDSLVYVPKNFVSHNQLIRKDDVIITMSSGSKEHIGKFVIAGEKMQAGYGAFCAKISFKDEYFYIGTMALKSVNFKNYIKNMCLGTNINNLTTKHIDNFEIIVPSKDINEKIVNFLAPLYSKISKNKIENQELAKLRDWLLPMLMNGQVSVSAK